MAQILKEFVNSLSEKKKHEEDVKKMENIFKAITDQQKDIIYKIKQDPKLSEKTAKAIEDLSKKKEKSKYVELKIKMQPY
jgi:DNA-binding ferritin-like protein